MQTCLTTRQSKIVIKLRNRAPTSQFFIRLVFLFSDYIYHQIFCFTDVQLEALSPDIKTPGSLPHPCIPFHYGLQICPAPLSNSVGSMGGHQVVSIQEVEQCTRHTSLRNSANGLHVVFNNCYNLCFKLVDVLRFVRHHIGGTFK